MVQRFKRKITILVIIIILLFILIVKLFPAIILSFGNKEKLIKLASEKGIQYEEDNLTFQTIIFKYNITDLIKYLSMEETETISFKTYSNFSYIADNEEYVVDVNMSNKNQNSKYTIVYGIGEELEEEEFENEKEVKFKFNVEGKNECSIYIKKDGETLEDYKWSKNIYYIKAYNKQFLDELEMHGVSDYFEWCDISEELDLFRYLGEKVIRSDIRQKTISESGYTLFDKTIPKMIENNYKIIGILGGFSEDFLGEDGKVSNDEELEKFLNYAEGIITRYPDIYAYEILNEPNAIYTSEEDIMWYVKMVSGVQDIIENEGIESKVISGVTVNPNTDTDTRTPSITFLRKINEQGAYSISNAYSYHLYDFSTTGKLNEIFQNSTKKHKSFINEIGGFQRIYITEMGMEAKDDASEEKQAIKLIQEENMIEEKGVYMPIVFSFRNTGGRNWGICSFNYEPKKAYYALKNYYENTNGAEYIGKITTLEGISNENLEVHVYDKDGKPKIVVWSNDTTVDITIPYNNFKATDLYGKEIENKDGTLVITESPIYLDNVSESYFYQAISNMAVEKYSEFETNFQDEIANVPGLLQSVEALKLDIQGISTSYSEITSDIAINKTKQHYELGNKILQAYETGKLDVEYVKLSSMLDSLDDIGNSYEDLITVTTVQNNADLENTNKLIIEASKILEDNSHVDMVYPEKILEFAEDYYTTSSYINSLDEENPIKNGLIVSKNVHSAELAKWSKTFSEIWLDKFIIENPVSISYSETDITNNDVVATISAGDDVDSIVVTNNNSSKEYTFTENGTYTFEYTRRGVSGSITATVNNIDKKEPLIEVENNFTYDTPIIPKITEENVESVILKKDGNIVEGYEIGQELSEDGTYELTVVDEAGNTSTLKFKIKKESE